MQFPSTGILLKLRLAAGLWLCAIAASTAQAAPLVLHEDDLWQNITASITYLVDATSTKTIEEITALPDSAFHAPEGDSLNLGVNPGVVWLRVRLRNDSDHTNWVIELNNPRLEDVRLYDDGDKESDAKKVGTDYPVADRLALHVLPALRIKVPAHAETTAVLRVKHSGSTRFQVQLSTMERFRQQVTNRTAATFLLAGGLLAMALFNLVVFIQLREMAYLYLAAAVLSFLAFTVAMNGSGYLWVWPDAHWWSRRSVTTSGMIHHAFITLFFRRFMKPVPGLAWLRAAALWLAGLFLLLALLALTDVTFKYYPISFMAAAGPLLIELGAIYAWRKGFQPAGHFAFAWGIGVCGVLFLSTLNAGWLEHSYLRESLISVAYLISVILWNLSLAERLRASELAQRQLLEAQVRAALDQVETLSVLVPICSTCNKIRDDRGFWQGVEHYLREHTGATLSHGMCPDCMERLYPGYAARVAEFKEE